MELGGRLISMNGLKKNGEKNSLEMCGSHCEIHEIGSGVGVLPDIR